MNKQGLVEKIHLVTLFGFIEQRGHKIASAEMLENEYLRHVKMLRESVRKRLKDTDVGILGYNVYKRNKISFKQLYENASRFIDFDHEKCILKTEVEMFIRNFHTNDYCEDFLQYRNAIRNYLNEVNVYHYLKEYSIEQCYYQKMSIEKACDQLSSAYDGRSYQYHLENLVALELTMDDTHAIFHIRPRLLLPVSGTLFHIDLEVSYQMDGMAKRNMKVLTPYPNKRWCVGATNLSKDRRKILGFYMKIPQDLDCMELCYRWIIDHCLTVEHNMLVKFNQSSQDKFYSTCQYSIRKNDTRFPQNEACTILGEEDLRVLMEQLNFIKRQEKEAPEKATLTINEEVTLTAFNPRVHHCFTGDKYFYKWYEEHKDKQNNTSSEQRNTVK